VEGNATQHSLGAKRCHNAVKICLDETESVDCLLPMKDKGKQKRVRLAQERLEQTENVAWASGDTENRPMRDT
jgi:hypothetical protein